MYMYTCITLCKESEIYNSKGVYLANRQICMLFLWYNNTVSCSVYMYTRTFSSQYLEVAIHILLCLSMSLYTFFLYSSCYDGQILCADCFVPTQPPHIHLSGNILCTCM